MNHTIKNEMHSLYAKQINDLRAYMHQTKFNIIAAKRDLTIFIDRDRNDPRVAILAEHLKENRARMAYLVKSVKRYKKMMREAS